MEKPTLGEQELEALRYVAEHAPVTAREVVEHFAEERGVARTTVLTVLERLRKKGFLQRRRREGVFHYTPHVSKGELLQGLVRDFVEKTLGGSVSPVVTYLTQCRRMTEAEIAELERLVADLRSGQEKPDA